MKNSCKYIIGNSCGENMYKSLKKYKNSKKYISMRKMSVWLKNVVSKNISIFS